MATFNENTIKRNGIGITSREKQITGFPVVTEEQFTQKVIAYGKRDAEKSTETKMIICKCCSKQFQSANAYDNHLSSRKHKESEIRSFQRNVMRKDEMFFTENQINDLHRNHFDEADIEEVGCCNDSGSLTIDEEAFDESEVIPETVCLFCNYSSDDVETNLVHMSVSHGFFLPDADFCTDVSGMLFYLGLKVGSGNMCLVCNERKRFCSLDACQKHMRDKGHCRVARSVEEMLEFEEFYDYSSMYPEGEVIDHSDSVAVVDDGYTLSLPSGATVGHRSLLRYYRQRLKPVTHETKSDRQRKENLKKAIIGQYQKLGWNKTSGALAVQRARDVRYMKKIDSRNLLKLGINSTRLFKSRGRNDQ